MSDKVFSEYIKQIDKYHMACSPVEFAQKTLKLCSHGFGNSNLTPSEYMQVCKYRAKLVIGHG